MAIHRFHFEWVDLVGAKFIINFSLKILKIRKINPMMNMAEGLVGRSRRVSMSNG